MHLDIVIMEKYIGGRSNRRDRMIDAANKGIVMNKEEGAGKGKKVGALGIDGQRACKK